MTALRWTRGALALGTVLLWLGLFALPSILALGIPARWVHPARRLTWVSGWARGHCRLVFGMLRLGGARFVRRGGVPTDGPGIVVMNHQSLLDIPTAVLLCDPLVPAFVTRARYTRVPMISTGLWLAACPVIDPRADRAAAVETLRAAVRGNRTILLYPEGHRSPDGTLRPFRSAGLLAMLAERRVPVWLVATDGFSGGRGLADLAHLHRIRGVTEVLGRFDPPEDAAVLPAFVEKLQLELARGLAAIRGRSG